MAARPAIQAAEWGLGGVITLSGWFACWRMLQVRNWRSVQITIGAPKVAMLEGVAVACLRLGILPQTWLQRENFSLQIPERLDEILA